MGSSAPLFAGGDGRRGERPLIEWWNDDVVKSELQRCDSEYSRSHARVS
jgi:hypothetical protein